MKKVLLSLFVAGAGIMSAQTYSFEQSEGFFPGEITGQSDEWSSTGIEGGGNIEGQLIIDSDASDGSQSFKNSYLAEYGAQENGPIIGAFYDPSEPIEISSDFTFSYDFKGEWDGNASDFVVQMFTPNPTDPTSLQIVQYLDFNYTGGFSTVGYNADGGLTYVDVDGYEWSTNEWHTVSIEFNGFDFDLYIDGTQYGSIPVITDGPIAHVRFVHDNWGFDGYYDNISFNGDMGVSEVAVNRDVTVVSPNPARAMVNVRLAEGFDTNKTTVTLSNVTGKTVATFADVNSVNVNKLPAGVYFMTITDGNKTETKKIIKK